MSTSAKKICPVCQQKLSASAFNSSAREPDGLARHCRACTNARRRQRERAAHSSLKMSASKRRAPTPPRPSLAAAIRTGDLRALQKLLGGGPAPHWGWVCEALREGQPAAAQALLDSGAEQNVFTLAALGDWKKLARRLNRSPTEARFLASFKPTSEQVTPLHVACASDWSAAGPAQQTAQVETAKILAAHGAELDPPARFHGIGGATPLLCACWTSRNMALVRWLLDRGAVPSDAHVMAALGHLQRHGRAALDIAECLLEWGVPVDGAPRGGRTPLQAMAHQASHRQVAWLIAHGADVNVRGPDGRTAAHYAAERNTSLKTLALLVQHGADLSARDADDRTPLEIAKFSGKHRLVAWIAQHTRTNRR